MAPSCSASPWDPLPHMTGGGGPYPAVQQDLSLHVQPHLRLAGSCCLVTDSWCWCGLLSPVSCPFCSMWAKASCGARWLA